MNLIYLLLQVGGLFLAVVCMLRFMFQLCLVDFYNPIVTKINRYTNPILNPLRRLLPRSKRIDLASLLLAWLAWVVLHYIAATGSTEELNHVYILFGALLQLLQYIVYLLIGCIIAIAIMSWFAPQSPSAIVRLARQICEPLLRPVRNVLPSLGGLDFSTAVVLIALFYFNSLVIRFLVNQLYSLTH